jgi:ParB family chromosome partitioning protein
MEIELEKLNVDAFDVRDEPDEEHISEIAESLREDGQWNPIIVRPNGKGTYDIIAGHTRYRAAERIEWSSLEANIKDVDEQEAKELALKTNLKREPMSKIEEGQVVNKILDRHNLTEGELAEQLGKSSSWVNDRIRVALDLEPEVKGLVEEGDLSYSVAREVRRVDADRQLEFAKLLIERGVTGSSSASQFRRQFENDTIYTVGYEGRNFEGFVTDLLDAGVDILIDVRASGESTYKPEFGSELLADRLPEHNIEYRHEPDLGVHRMIRSPYKDGAISDRCFADWYNWWLDNESGVDVEELVTELVTTGAPALMCIERYPEPTDDQSIYCHRHHLAERIQSVERDGRALFPNRVNL